MRHVIVTRVTLLVFVLFLAAAGLFAWITAPARTGDPARPATGEDGGRLFESHCASCHDAGSLRPGAGALDAAGRRSLERFLENHGTATSDEDRRIVEYLAAENPRPRP